MAPSKSSSKRASVAPAAAASKKPRADPTLAAVKEVVQQSDLPDTCRKMVLACLPSLAGTPAAERQGSHLLAVTWVEEIMSAAQGNLEKALAEQAAAVEAAEQAGTGLGAAVSGAEAALAAAAEEAKAKTASLAEATQAQKAAKDHVKQQEEAQAAGDEDMNKNQAALTALEAAIVEHYQTLGEAESGEAHHVALLPHIRGAGLEESLLAALPAACNKKSEDRTAFDTMVIDALGSCLRAKASSLSEAVAAAAPAAQARADAVARAREGLEAAAGAQREQAEALVQAQAAERAASEALKAAKAEAAAHGPRTEQAKKARDERAQALETFQNYSKACWELMRDGQPSKAEGKLEAQDAEAATPVAAAGA